MSKARLRELISLVYKFFTVLIIGLVIIIIINEVFLGGMEDFFNGIFYIVLASFSIEIVSIVVIYGMYFFKNNCAPEKTEFYERDIPKEIPPAIASILLDFYVEEEQDYLSTVSSLISRGYLEIVNNQEIIIKNNNIEGLLEHEILVFDIISRRALYSPSEFRKKTIQDAKKLGLIEKTNRLILKWKSIGKCILNVLILFIISIIGAAMPEMLEDYEFISPLAWTIFWIICAIYAYKIYKEVYFAFSYNSPTREQSLKYIYKKTKKGEKYAKKFAGLKKFLKDYTLLKERELESIIIYEDYIPYAIALGEADTIEMFIEIDEDCRRLIYRV